MSLAVSDPLLSPAVNARRRLHRRSSCSSIPRSVSTCSSVWGFDASCGEVETYMAPLFRGLEGAQEETAEPVSANQPDDLKPREESPHEDDALSENLSNYNFDIDGDEHNSSEQPNPSATEANPSQEQSPELVVRDDPPVTPKPQVDRPARPRPFLLQTPLPPGQLRPLVLAEAIIQDLPLTGTRPLRIDRSKKRQEQSSVPQRPPRADVLYVRPSVRPIYRAATQVNLREAYKRASPHSVRTVQTRHIPIARPPPFGPLPEIPNVDKLVPVATLFPTGLIPLEHAQDKFKHAHCLDRLPPLTQNQSNIAKTPTSATSNRSPRTLSWSFSRAFRKQKD